jgi:hypothetical protein
MKRIHEEKTEAQESLRVGAWQIRRISAQRGQAAGQSREIARAVGSKAARRPDPRRMAQRSATSARSSQEVVNAIIALIRVRFGDVAIGLGELGIHYRAASNR